MAGLKKAVPFTLLIASTVLAFDCSKPPIYVDIHKRAVRGTNILQYGSFIGFGTPSQNQSLFPSLRQNETSVASGDFCGRSQLRNCEGETHGTFDASFSRSWIEDKTYRSLDSSQLSNASTFGTDSGHLYTHFFETNPATVNTVDNFSLEVVSSSSSNPGVIGFGAASTLLQKIYAAGLIAGRTYSLYIGAGMDRAGGVVNGSNTFGGFDSGRFTGPVFTNQIDTSSADPLAVTVTDIILDDPTGLTRNVSLMDSVRFPNISSVAQGFTARITTDQYPMTFPPQITENFMSLLTAVETDPNEVPDHSLRITKSFAGTMTIVLSDGFRVTLPPEMVSNSTGLSPVASGNFNWNGSPMEENIFYLGASWLSQVYLMIDYEAYNFHLAQAVVENKYVMPTTWCPKSIPVAKSAESESDFGANGLVGAVLGGVIGGIAFIACCVIGILYLLRYRTVKKMERLEAEEGMKKRQYQDMEDGSSSDGSVKGPSRDHSTERIHPRGVFGAWRK
ncbi:acid protease [Eremomyces bilateralis CBS 781.70]|uniref:Acid protease n=1 Tax=Eremomyces bilateralis CBS 781.70 TaxID=1392243 RepID=A0A6G1FUQ5_9PEZI|nr:acid protease [Eremomyces bilateralis CBS 781.70]KAF1809625.1 acid protease [Eremomyces bilateralis CBS 781.70]